MATENEIETPVEFPDHVVVEYQTPPVKDQLVQAAIGIGASVAPIIIYVAAAAVIGGVSVIRARRQAKKLAKSDDTIVVTEETPEEN